VVVVAVKVHKERRQLMVQEHLVREIEVVLMGILEQQRLPTLPVVEVVLAQLAAAVWIAHSVDLDLRVMVG